MSSQAGGRPLIDPPPANGDHGLQHNNQQQTFSPSGHYAPGAANGYEPTSAQGRNNTGLAIGDNMTTNGASGNPPIDGRSGRNPDNTQNLAIRERSKARANGGTGTKGSSGNLRTCQKCGEALTGQFVRALGGTFHLDCFRCRDCGQVVASKFFPVDPPKKEEDEEGEGQYPLCETDYFRRIDLICFACGGALRGSYITALERKYHIEHFTCSVCPTIFGAQDSYYEHEDKVYCHYHYSTQFAQRCNGCQTAILKQFVEIFRNGQNQHWHPECYMIHKFWNVRLATPGSDNIDKSLLDNAGEEERTLVREEEEQMEAKVYRIWSVLSTFEESSAACISDMLLHVSNGAFVDGVLVAKKFIWHVDILFGATDRLDYLMLSQGIKGLAYGREAKLLCKKIVAFFSLLSKTQETGVRKLGVTQELLSLVTGLAHYLKLLIRISLQGALKLERERSSMEGLHRFLNELGDLESLRESQEAQSLNAGVSGLDDQQSDLCDYCQEPIDDECVQSGQRRWHTKHLSCAKCRTLLGDTLQDAFWSDAEHQVFCRRCVEERRAAQDGVANFDHVTRLQQYVYLLRVALARLLSVLRSGGTLPHTSDDPNLAHYDSNDGHRLGPSGQAEPPLLRSTSRSKSYGGTTPTEHAGSSYEQTVGEMKRLRSTRMDKHLSTTIKKARTSRIIDGPEGLSTGPGSTGPEGAEQSNNGFKIIEDRDAPGQGRTDLAFGNQDALTLDDIPRIVAAEQAKEQRPNAYRHAKNQLIGHGGRPPKLVGGHQREVSGGHELDNVPTDGLPQRTKRFFSELSALEYFIVRHVAVLSMQPLLEGHFTLEELLSLIETRKPGTFWGKFGKAFKNDKPKGGKKKGVFGVPLEALVEREGIESTYSIGPGRLRVPGIIDDAIAAMRQMDMSVEGVFRKNGNIRGLKDLAERIDTGTYPDLTRENPVQVAALLKKFLRELPDPLMTYKLHRLWITSQKIPDEDKKRRILHLTCCLLPKSHRDSLEILFSFLVWVSSFSQVDEESGSKMDTHNLATVISPNILKDQDTKKVVSDESFLAIEAVNTLIEYNDQMCEVPEDLQTILNDSSLFNNASDITTKEILKRYGNIGTHRPAITTQTADAPPLNKDSAANTPRAAAPVITHVETDPYGNHEWPMESSVRHVQGPGAAPMYPSLSNSQGTPPQRDWELAHPNSPYAHQRQGSSDSQASHGGGPHRQSYRQAGWAKGGGPGLSGVPGTT